MERLVACGLVRLRCSTVTADSGHEVYDTAHKPASLLVVPIHHEGRKDFSESREEISRTFEAVGVNGRLGWMEPGTAIIA